MTGPVDTRGRVSTSYAGLPQVNELAQLLSDLARSLQHERGLRDTLAGITRAAVETVPGAVHAGISEVRGKRRVETRAATTDVVVEVDRAQYRLAQGPCVEAIRSQVTVRLSDMAADPRWPEFGACALALGVRAMLSFQLYVTDDNLGALNLYSDRVGAFTNESEHVGLLFAAHAAVAMIGARQRQDGELALAMRDVIGQAKGILMERHRISAAQAFDLLVAASQRTHLRLAEVATRLTETGELPA